RFAMAARKSLALCVLVWGALASSARGEAISWASGMWGQSRVWVYGQGQGPVNDAQDVLSNSATDAPAPAPQVPVVSSSTTISTAMQGSSAQSDGAGAAAGPSTTSPAPASSFATPSATTSSGPVNAYVNLGTAPYADASLITTGNAQPWYNSAQASSF